MRGGKIILKVVLVDDEIPALQRFEKLFKDEENFKIIGVYSRATEFLREIKDNNMDVDIVFLDVEMPDIDGLSLAKKILDISETIEIVFVTGYNKYAIEAFEINALDYLLKPVSKKRFQKTLDRIMVRRTFAQKEGYLRVLCLGRIKIIDASGLELNMEWRTSKTKELFAYLVHHRGEFIDSDKIIYDLWENDNETLKKPTAILHTTVYYLRKLFKGIGYSNLIESKKGCYRVNLVKIACDFIEFERLIKENQKFDNNSIKNISKIIKLYNGDYLAHEDYRWVFDYRMVLRDKFLHLIMQAANYYLKEKKYLIAEEFLKRLIREDPLYEKAHEELITVYELVGDRIAARRQYEYLRQILNDEFGIEPKSKYD